MNPEHGFSRREALQLIAESTLYIVVTGCTNPRQLIRDLVTPTLHPNTPPLSTPLLEKRVSPSPAPTSEPTPAPEPTPTTQPTPTPDIKGLAQTQIQELAQAQGLALKDLKIVITESPDKKTATAFLSSLTDPTLGWVVTKDASGKESLVSVKAPTGTEGLTWSWADAKYANGRLAALVKGNPFAWYDQARTEWQYGWQDTRGVARYIEKSSYELNQYQVEADSQGNIILYGFYYNKDQNMNHLGAVWNLKTDTKPTIQATVDPKARKESRRTGVVMYDNGKVPQPLFTEFRTTEKKRQWRIGDFFTPQDVQGGWFTVGKIVSANYVTGEFVFESKDNNNSTVTIKAKVTNNTVYWLSVDLAEHPYASMPDFQVNDRVRFGFRTKEELESALSSSSFIGTLIGLHGGI